MSERRSVRARVVDADPSTFCFFLFFSVFLLFSSSTSCCGVSLVLAQSQSRWGRKHAPPPPSAMKYPSHPPSSFFRIPCPPPSCRQRDHPFPILDSFMPQNETEPKQERKGALSTTEALIHEPDFCWMDVTVYGTLPQVVTSEWDYKGGLTPKSTSFLEICEDSSL